MVFGLRKPMLMSKVRNSEILTPFVTSLSSKFPQMVQLKRNKIRSNDFFFYLKLGVGMFFLVGNDYVKLSKFRNPNPVCDVAGLQSFPKSPKIQLNEMKFDQMFNLNKKLVTRYLVS